MTWAAKSSRIDEAVTTGVLDPDLVDVLSKIGTRRTVLGGELLFAEGDLGDSMYLVERGRLSVFEMVEGEEVPIRTLGPGDVVGELALLCGLARTASVRALRDSFVLRVTDDAFQGLIASDSDFTRALVRMLGDKLRTRSVARLAPPRSQVVAIVPLDPEAPALEVAHALADCLGQPTSDVCLDVGQAGDDEQGWGAALDSLERRSRVAVLVGTSATTPDAWTSFCIRQADRIVGVAGAAPRGVIHRAPGADLVLCRAAAHRDPTRAWLDRLQPRAHHRVPDPQAPGAVDRLARRLTGNSVGLVFSGGGARGIAHLGVLEVLEQAGAVVDRVGGTSMGALVAALNASGMPASDMVDWCRREFVVQRPFRDYTIPRTALLRARRARSMLDRCFGDSHIEDLELDCFAVSADLGSAQLVVHRRGSVVEAVGASMSLPGLAPPVHIGDRWLVDGGVLNNLPIDVMVLADEGPVVAVDVMSHAPMRPSARGPSIIETLARTTVIGSHQQAQERAALADALITPDLAGIGLLDFAMFDDALRAGRQAARVALDAGVIPGLAGE